MADRDGIQRAVPRSSDAAIAEGGFSQLRGSDDYTPNEANSVHARSPMAGRLGALKNFGLLPRCFKAYRPM